METSDQYINRESRIELDYVHNTLQECLNGNVDKHMVEESLNLIEKYRDREENERRGQWKMVEDLYG